MKNIRLSDWDRLILERAVLIHVIQVCDGNLTQYIHQQKFRPVLQAYSELFKDSDVEWPSGICSKMISYVLRLIDHDAESRDGIADCYVPCNYAAVLKKLGRNDSRVKAFVRNNP